MLRIEPLLAFINGVLLENRVLIFRFQLLSVYVLLVHNCGECRIAEVRRKYEKKVRKKVRKKVLKKVFLKVQKIIIKNYKLLEGGEGRPEGGELSFQCLRRRSTALRAAGRDTYLPYLSILCDNLKKRMFLQNCFS
jgi:hypothetical protein